MCVYFHRATRISGDQDLRIDLGALFLNNLYILLPLSENSFDEVEAPFLTIRPCHFDIFVFWFATVVSRANYRVAQCLPTRD